MTSDDTKLLIGRIERAISRIETHVRTIEQAPPPAPAAPSQTSLSFDSAAQPAEPGYSRDDALAALKSLDGLIARLEEGRANG